MKVRNVAKDARDSREDLVLANITDRRMATFNRKTGKPMLRSGVVETSEALNIILSFLLTTTEEEDVPNIPRNLRHQITVSDAIEPSSHL